jgi:restriction system protein
LGDGGIDGIAKEDRLGLDMVYVRARRWASTVGRPTVQEFTGGLEGKRARKGVLVATSASSGDAKECVSRIDRRVEHGIGVEESAKYVLFRIDADYFGEE